MNIERIEAEYRLHFDNAGSVVRFAHHVATIARNEALEDAAKMLDNRENIACNLLYSRLVRDMKNKESK